MLPRAKSLTVCSSTGQSGQGGERSEAVSLLGAGAVGALQLPVAVGNECPPQHRSPARTGTAPLKFVALPERRKQQQKHSASGLAAAHLHLVCASVWGDLCRSCCRGRALGDSESLIHSCMLITRWRLALIF